MRDQSNDLAVSTSIAPAAIKATTNGTGVDLANVNAATVVFTVGTITDGTHTPTVQESADNATWTDVAASDLVGALADLASNTNQQVGYIGKERYIRAVSTVGGAPATGGVYGAHVVRSMGRHLPIS